MRLPKDTEDWRISHAERAITEAERLFREYENKVDFDHPEDTDDLYSRFVNAKELAEDVANVVGVRELVQRAKMLG